MNNSATIRSCLNLFIFSFSPFVLPISIVFVDFPDLLHRTHPLSCFIIQQNGILVNKNLKFRKKKPIKRQKTTALWKSSVFRSFCTPYHAPLLLPLGPFTLIDGQFLQVSTQNKKILKKIKKACRTNRCNRPCRFRRYIRRFRRAKRQAPPKEF